MLSDLGSRLVRSGLISRDQLAHALAATQLDGGILAARLIEQGLNEEALAGLFLGDGYGPLVSIEELATAERRAVERISAEMARELLALPIRIIDQGLVVAMADPTDPHLIHELALAASMDVLPKVSFISDLRVAIEHAYQHVDTARTSPDARRQATHRPGSWLQSHLQASSWPVSQSASAAPRPQRRDTGQPHRSAQGPTGTLRPPSVAGFVDEHMFIPLAASGHGQHASPGAYRSKRRSSRPADELDHDFPDSFAPETTVSYNPPASVEDAPTQELHAPLRAPGEQPWSELLVQASPHGRQGSASQRLNGPPPRQRQSIIGERLRSLRPSADPSPPDIAPTLASIRASRDSDQILRFACYGAASVSTLAVALVLRKGTLEGREAAGVGVPREAIRKIWIPTETTSVFQKVLATGETYHGPHGTHAADVLFRSSTGSRGPELLIEPIFLHGRIVAMLCVDGPLYGSLGQERIRTLSYAVSEALARIIMSSKK